MRNARVNGVVGVGVKKEFLSAPRTLLLRVLSSLSDI